MAEPPAVTVLMAVRDSLPHLPETIASLQALAPPPDGIEFVVVDDASGDGSETLLRTWAADDARVRVLREDRGQGLATALNRGLAEARAPLIARADGDDLYAPGRLLRQVARMKAEPALGVLSCGYARIDAEGREIDRRVPPTGAGVLRFRMLFMSPLLHPGAMFRTDLVRAAGGYDPAFWTAQDSDLWARLAEVTRLDNLTDCLVFYRVHDSSVMKRRGTDGQRLSLTVPARLQRAYLGGLAPDHDVAATVDLFQGFRPMDPAELASGLPGLCRIRDVAMGRESAGVLADFHAHAAASLARQARWCRGRAPLLALRLWRMARAWRPAEPAMPAEMPRAARR